jgi:hypothetical protein
MVIRNAHLHRPQQPWQLQPQMKCSGFQEQEVDSLALMKCGVHAAQTMSAQGHVHWMVQRRLAFWKAPLGHRHH